MPINEEGGSTSSNYRQIGDFYGQVFIGRLLTPALLRQESMHNPILGPVIRAEKVEPQF